jgi:uncharacterized protein (DUF305 family)
MILGGVALVGVMATIASAQTGLSPVEQARRDSVYRPYTKADIEFVSGMIHHHGQAIQMARMCPSHGANRSIATLCRRVETGQSAEIGIMQTWLKDRNQPVPEPDPRGMKHVMGGVEHYMPMPGMLTEAEMAKLDSARGPEFDRLFLTYMIKHHQGAIGMVDTLFNTPGAGNDEIVFRLATDVHVDQSTEIGRMKQMLEALTVQKTSPKPPVQ